MPGPWNEVVDACRPADAPLAIEATVLLNRAQRLADLIRALPEPRPLFNPFELETRARPTEGMLSAGTLGYFIRPGRHSMTRADWKVFLDYADHHFGRR